MYARARLYRGTAAPGKRGGRLSQQGKPTKQRRVLLSEDEDDDMEESASQDDSGSEFDAGAHACVLVWSFGSHCSVPGGERPSMTLALSLLLRCSGFEH
eukprot:1160134-Pelagomonas_calceolata.AAC.1